MEVIYIMLPLAILMAGGFLAAFLWSVHRGQYDEMDTPRYRAIFDDEPGGKDSLSPVLRGEGRGEGPDVDKR